MGIFFNPGNGSFTKDRNYEIYVDKTELLKYLNRAIGTPGNCIAVSHARRFGKSHAAGMIDAYYSLGSDSAKLFKGTKIASDPDYEKYRNKYNVIHLDISSFWDFHKKDIVEKIIVVLNAIWFLSVFPEKNFITPSILSILSANKFSI